MITLTNELRQSYNANEQIATNYEEKIKNLNKEFDKRILIFKIFTLFSSSEAFRYRTRNRRLAPYHIKTDVRQVQSYGRTIL